MKKIGFIFDLDGVIVDTAKYHYLAWKKLAGELGFEFTIEQNELFKGVSRKRCLEILLDIGKIEATQEQFDNWMVEKNVDYLKYIENMNASEILPDVVRVLKLLKERQIRIALGSASKNARPILEKVDLLHYFDCIVDGNNVTKAKPDPEVFLIAAEQLRVNSDNCVVFEGTILSEADHNFKDFTEIKTSFINELIG